jgi:uncharacterized membrane protein
MSAYEEWKALQRRPARRARRAMERSGALLLGVVFGLFGAGLVLLVAKGGGRAGMSLIMASLILGLGLFIGLFGADMAWQSA